MLSRSSLFFPQTETGRKTRSPQCSTPPKREVLPTRDWSTRNWGQEAGGGPTHQPGRGPESEAPGLYHWVPRYSPASRGLGSEVGRGKPHSMKASGLPPHPPGTPTRRQGHALTTPRTPTTQSPHKRTQAQARGSLGPHLPSPCGVGAGPQRPLTRGCHSSQGHRRFLSYSPLARAEVVPWC